jgi:hypothetical protein
MRGAAAALCISVLALARAEARVLLQGTSDVHGGVLTPGSDDAATTAAWAAYATQANANDQAARRVRLAARVLPQRPPGALAAAGQGARGPGSALQSAAARPADGTAPFGLGAAAHDGDLGLDAAAPRRPERLAAGDGCAPTNLAATLRDTSRS